MTRNTYLEMKLLNNLFSKPSAAITKALGKQSTPKNVPIGKTASRFNLITLNTSNSLTLCHGETL